ncbi:MAG: hypothetical protein EBQ54_08195 [Actinobacteria bacterium]|nr:hypothetical protein [Actinomycetota bacterium]
MPHRVYRQQLLPFDVDPPTGQHAVLAKNFAGNSPTQIPNLRKLQEPSAANNPPKTLRVIYAVHTI